MSEERSGHPEFYEILDSLAALHDRKNRDYGTDADPLASCRGSVSFGIPAHMGVWVRMGDKFQRLQSFAQNGSLANEGVEDTLLDLAAYSILSLILYRETRQPQTYTAPPGDGWEEYLPGIFARTVLTPFDGSTSTQSATNNAD